MPAIASNVIVESETFRANRAAHLELIAEFRALERKVRDASARADEKFRSRGQLPPRERSTGSSTATSPFLELSSLCGLGMHEDDGVGNVYRRRLDRRHRLRCGRALQWSRPTIRASRAAPLIRWASRRRSAPRRSRCARSCLTSSSSKAPAPIFMLQAEMFVRGGATFANMARLSAAGIPVISIVHGSSTAGGAYQTGLADYVVMVRGRSKVFLAGPPLLKAATGEIAEDEALGGAELHCVTTGLGEYLAEDDADALRIGREILAHIGWGAPPPRPRAPAPLYDPEELLGIVPVDYRKPYDVREVIARLVDGSEFLDFKPRYGAETVCGHAAIEGRAVGLIGNNGPIDSAGASKAGQFIQLCCQAGLPIVFLQNTTGYLVGVDAETSGIVKHGSKMIQAVTNAERAEAHAADRRLVRRRPLRHVRPRVRTAFPVFLAERPRRGDGRRTGGQSDGDRRRGAARARRSLPFDAEKTKAQGARIVASYDRQSTALFATARLWDDGLIDPRDSRATLAFCLETCAESRRAGAASQHLWRREVLKHGRLFDVHADRPQPQVSRSTTRAARTRFRPRWSARSSARSTRRRPASRRS